MNDKDKSRPTVLLHDNWGQDREATDEEITHFSRLHRWLDALRWTAIIIAVLGFIVVWLFTIWLVTHVETAP